MGLNIFKALSGAPGNLKNKLSLYTRIAPQVQKSIKSIPREQIASWTSSDEGFYKLAEKIHSDLDQEFRDQFTPVQLEAVLKMNKGLLNKA